MKKAFTAAILFFGILLSMNGQNSLQLGHYMSSPTGLKFSSDTVSIFIIGDVMMHTPQLNRDHRMFLRHIAPEMQKADFAVANMEFPLGGPPYTGYPAFSAPDYMLEYLTECGNDVILTANNHIFDKGRKGLERTLAHLHTAKDSVLFTGTYSNSDESLSLNPLILEKDDLKIALINFTYGLNGGPQEGYPNVNYMDKDSISVYIERAKGSNADFIVALPHWGDEYELRHNQMQEKWAEWLAGQGVDAIVGSHPHVVQDTAHINGTAVIYSMGNAVSNMSAENTRLELAVVLRFVRDGWSGRKTMLEPELRFMWCTLPGKLTDSYATIFVKDWTGRRSEWKSPSDYDNMMETYKRVKVSTGVED